MWWLFTPYLLDYHLLGKPWLGVTFILALCFEQCFWYPSKSDLCLLSVGALVFIFDWGSFISILFGGIPILIMELSAWAPITMFPHFLELGS